MTQTLTHSIGCVWTLFLQDFLGPEEAAMEDSSDVEFEGIGDYQESILARWSQPKAKGDVGDS